MATSPAVPTYDVEQLADLLVLLPDVDSVELKLTVPDDRLRSVVQTLGIDPLDAVVRQVAFVDTPDLRLSEGGVVVRARRTQRKPGDVTVKLRPMLPADAPPELRDHDGFKVELDASPQGYTCSCSLTASVPDGRVRKLLAGTRTLDELLDGTQRKLLIERMPDGVGMADLTVLGPVNLLKCRFTPAGHGRRLVAELWVLPDGSRILELSTKATPDAAFQVAAETKVLLASKGVDLGAPQETKTRSALAALVAERDATGERHRA
ncbi:hypothetical protein BCE75_11426 [Isoptericola sp. CG 20/1183]|uniref:Adenylate cyclase n=1 Tax=Isoptericola halotolerans TaxID=300560 RepID=A0ABX5EA04_9MICO|nr:MULTISPECIES: adenylate cyclase [Isoptericola]PRZ03214.1 hypothetical protein BCE75_11426 [Isoptericola sp. CG 20/1183]PRZ03574.1 hypothetical protein BCL65_11375 [Isoptericola halotolerans]